MAKGLQAALSKGANAAKAKKHTVSDAPQIADLQLLPLSIDVIHPDPNQPRREWETGELEELAAAIEQTGGCHTPIKVKPHPEKLGEYMLVYGEGRWRSHHMKNIPLINALIDTDFSNPDSEFLTFFVQVTENVSRNQMKKIDEANAYHKLMNIHKPNKLTQVELSSKVGKPKTYISRVLKLLKAPYEVQELSTLNVTQNLNVLAYLTQISEIVTNEELLRLIDEVRSGELGEKTLQRHLSELQNPTSSIETDQGQLSETRYDEQLVIDGLTSETTTERSSTESRPEQDYGFYDYENVYEKALFDVLFSIDLAFEISEEQKEEAIDKLEAVTNEWEAGDHDDIKHSLSELLDGFKLALPKEENPLKTILNTRTLRAMFKSFMTEPNQSETEDTVKGDAFELDSYEVFNNHVLLNIVGLAKPLKVTKKELTEILSAE